MPLVLALAGRKGGIGKSSTVLQLAGAATAKGARVLVVDLDPQCTLTQQLLGRDPMDADNPRATAEAIEHGATVAELMQPAPRVPGCQVLPGRPHLTLARDHSQLHLATAPVDLVLVDTAPDTRSRETMAALTSSHAVVIPVVPSTPAMLSIPLMHEVIDLARVYNPELELAGYLLTQTEPRLRVQQICEQQVRDAYGPQVMKATLPRLTAFQESAACGLPVHLMPKTDAARKAVDAVYTETLRRLEAARKRGAA